MDANQLAAANARAADRDRYVQGMANWKATAEAKDAQIAAANRQLDDCEHGYATLKADLAAANAKLAAKPDVAERWIAAVDSSGMPYMQKDANGGFVLYDTLIPLSAQLAEKEAENEALRKDAERGRYMIRNCAWHRRDDHDGRYASMVVQLPYEADLSCVATREHAIDAAIAAREKP